MKREGRAGGNGRCFGFGRHSQTRAGLALRRVRGRGTSPSSNFRQRFFHRDALADERFQFVPAFFRNYAEFDPFPLVPKLQLGNLLLGSSCFPSRSISLSPFPTNLDQSRLPKIISRAGVTPVLRSVHITSRHWIMMMDVIELLTHHRLAYDGLRVIAFLPKPDRGFRFCGRLKSGS